MSKLVEVLAGQVYGRLTVVKEVGCLRSAKGTMVRRVECRCACGTQSVFRLSDVRHGNTISCGCYGLERMATQFKTHGQCVAGSAHRAEFSAWRSMRKRCLCATDKSYPRYGGRGITICERWGSFENFLSDMGPRPSGMTLDRKENHLGYSPENCRWATAQEQALNRRSNVVLSFAGKQQTVSQWSAETSIPINTLYYRARAGWSADKILTTAVRGARP